MKARALLDGFAVLDRLGRIGSREHQIPRFRIGAQDATLVLFDDDKRIAAMSIFEALALIDATTVGVHRVMCLAVNGAANESDTQRRKKRARSAIPQWSRMVRAGLALDGKRRPRLKGTQKRAR